MDILPPPDSPPIGPAGYPLPPMRTSPAIIDKVLSFCISGEIETFREILDSPTSSSGDIHLNDLASVMLEAIKRDSVQFIEELLQHGMQATTLRALEAVEAKAKNALDTFIRHGWDINEPVSELKPPVLGYGVTDEDMTTFLLSRGADPNRQCVIDLMPLSWAVESAPISVIQSMLSHGGDVHRGELLHHVMERESEVVEVAKVLVDRGAPINAVMYQNHDPSWALFGVMGPGTPLHRAVELGKLDAVCYLVSAGADQTIRDGKGRTAMERAQALGRSEVIQALQHAS